jgi:valyl-tRNA synthetase
VWSWWRPGSIHRAAWPTAVELLTAIGGARDLEAERLYADVTDALGAIRRERALQKQPFKVPIRRATVAWEATRLEGLRRVEADLKRAANVDVLDFGAGEALAVQVEFDGNVPTGVAP